MPTSAGGAANSGLDTELKSAIEYAVAAVVARHPAAQNNTRSVWEAVETLARSKSEGLAVPAVGLPVPRERGKRAGQGTGNSAGFRPGRLCS
jgi:hypothetical protein